MYRIRVQDFEGPLDLLLYFIRRDELDVFDIPIARIADEYLDYVRLLEQIDLDSVGDFLYMAAILINLKARMLLPKEELDDDGEPVDPRRELVERLLEYVRYKEASSTLVQLQEVRSDRFTRGQASSERAGWQAQREVSYDATIFDLISALRRVLSEAPEEPTHPVQRENYSVEVQQAVLIDVLARDRRASFARIVSGRTRGYVIATFLGILELARQQRIRIILPDGSPEDFELEYVEASPQPDDGKRRTKQNR